MPKLFKQLVYIFYIPAIVFLLNEAVATWTMWFQQMPWIDKPFHFTGGFVIAISAHRALNILEAAKKMGKTHWLIRWFLVVAIVVMTAVFWEFYEFLTDHFLGTHAQLSNTDTMGDLFFGTLGGMLGGFVLSKIKKR